MANLRTLISSTFAALAVGTTLAAPAQAQDYKIGDLKITMPWTRATPVGSKVGGGFMRIENTGKESDFLIGGSSPIAARFEIHEMAMDKGMMKMRELPEGLEIAPGKSVELRPGSYHVMFMELKSPMKEGEKVKGTLKFKRAGTIEVEYRVDALGAKAPGQGGGHGSGSGKH